MMPLKVRDGQCKQLDKRIATLVRALSDTQMQRNSLQPMYGLAPELLLEIFFWVLADQNFKPNQSCLWLSQVCRRWRDLTLSSSRFWALIYNSSFPNALQHEFLNLFLERSQGSPLSVYIDTASQTAPRLHRFMKPIFAPATIGRVKTLSVAFNHKRRDDEARLVEKMTMNRRKGLLVLEHLEISKGWFVFGSRPVSSEENAPPVTKPPFYFACLRTLKILDPGSFDKALPMTSWSLPRTLVKLVLTCSPQWDAALPSWTTVLGVLRPMIGHLEILELHNVLRCSGNIPQRLSLIKRDRWVKFPRLYSLKLTGCLQPLGQFLGCLSLPGLCHFTLISDASKTIKPTRDHHNADGELAEVARLVYEMKTFDSADAVQFISQACKPTSTHAAAKSGQYRLTTWSRIPDESMLTELGYGITNFIDYATADVNICFGLFQSALPAELAQQDLSEYNMFERDFPLLSKSELAHKRLLILDCKDPVIPYTAALAMPNLRYLFLSGDQKVEVLKMLFEYGNTIVGNKLFPELRLIRFDQGLIASFHVDMIAGVLKARDAAGLKRVRLISGVVNTSRRPICVLCYPEKC